MYYYTGIIRIFASNIQDNVKKKALWQSGITSFYRRWVWM